jgi:hypothetical protein
MNSLPLVLFRDERFAVTVANGIPDNYRPPSASKMRDEIIPEIDCAVQERTKLILEQSQDCTLLLDGLTRRNLDVVAAVVVTPDGQSFFEDLIDGSGAKKDTAYVHNTLDNVRKKYPDAIVWVVTDGAAVMEVSVFGGGAGGRAQERRERGGKWGGTAARWGGGGRQPAVPRQHARALFYRPSLTPSSSIPNKTPNTKKQAGRRKLVAEGKILDAIPCQMHDFGLLIKDFTKLPWARSVIADTRVFESYIFVSFKVRQAILAAAKTMPKPPAMTTSYVAQVTGWGDGVAKHVSHGIISHPCRTRMDEVVTTLESIAYNKAAIRAAAAADPGLFAPKARKDDDDDDDDDDGDGDGDGDGNEAATAAAIAAAAAQSVVDASSASQLSLDERQELVATGTTAGMRKAAQQQQKKQTQKKKKRRPVADIVACDVYFERARLLARIGDVFRCVTRLVQSCDCTGAQVMLCWLFGGKALQQLLPEMLATATPAFAAGVINSFNKRVARVCGQGKKGTKFFRLALMLHPKWRWCLTPGEANVVIAYAKELAGRKFSGDPDAPNQVENTLRGFYLPNKPPYKHDIPDFATRDVLVAWWTKVRYHNTYLSDLAVSVANAVVTSAEVERSFSVVSILRGKHRCSLGPAMLKYMTRIRMYMKSQDRQAQDAAQASSGRGRGRGSGGGGGGGTVMDAAARVAAEVAADCFEVLNLPAIEQVEDSEDDDVRMQLLRDELGEEALDVVGGCWPRAGEEEEEEEEEGVSAAAAGVATTAAEPKVQFVGYMLDDPRYLRLYGGDGEEYR